MCKPVCHAVGSTVPHLRMLNNMTPRPSNLRPRVFPRAKIRLALADWWDEYTNSSLRHPRCGAQARKRGGTVFDVQPLVSGPEAVIALKQGFGRLIRSENDRGVLAILDHRLVKKSYGRVFFASLPKYRRTNQLDDVKAFMREC